MENEKNSEFEEEIGSQEEDYATDSASRARNRTVMLTPEITGEVRARLAKDIAGGSSDFVQPTPSGAPMSGDPAGGRPGSSYVPAGGNPSGSFDAPVAANQSVPVSGGVMPTSPGEAVVWSKESPVIGFLVSFDSNENGSVFVLRTGRLIVTSEAPGAGNFLVLQDETVSPMHAIIRISKSGDIQVLDQLSEFGTKIIRYSSGDEEELSGDKSNLEHGDVIVFGERRFYVCIVPVGDEDE